MNGLPERSVMTWKSLNPSSPNPSLQRTAASRLAAAEAQSLGSQIMRTVVLVVLLVSVSGVSAGQCPDPGHMLFLNDGDYGPGGIGPQGTLELNVGNHVIFNTHDWICPSGSYIGSFQPDDLELISCLIADLREDPRSRVICGGPHTPGFLVESMQDGWMTGGCIRSLVHFPVRTLYSVFEGAVVRAEWTSCSSLPPLPPAIQPMGGP